MVEWTEADGCYADAGQVEGEVAGAHPPAMKPPAGTGRPLVLAPLAGPRSRAHRPSGWPLGPKSGAQ